MLAEIVEASALPYVILDPDGTVRWAGRSIEDIYGRPPDALVGRNLGEFVVPDELPLALEAFDELTAPGADGSGTPLVIGLQRPDGVVRWTEVGGTPLTAPAANGGVLVRLRPFEGQRHFDLSIASLVGDEPLAAVFAHLARSARTTLGAAAVSIHHGFDRTRFASVDGDEVPEACRSLDEGPWVDAVRSGQRVQATLADLPPTVAAAARTAGFRACWSSPVPHRPDVVPAALTVWTEHVTAPRIGQRQTLERVVRYVQLALVRTAEQARLRHQAGHDSLTGLANRATFHAALTAALASGVDGLVVVYGDLDGFKAVNDRLGHLAGDALLAEVAARLRGSLRDGDIVGRVGGDEFTFLLHEVHDRHESATAAARLVSSLDEPFTVAGEQVSVSLSLGVARGRREDDADTLLARADRALYRVKAMGGGIGFDD